MNLAALKGKHWQVAVVAVVVVAVASWLSVGWHPRRMTEGFYVALGKRTGRSGGSGGGDGFGGGRGHDDDIDDDGGRETFAAGINPAQLQQTRKTAPYINSMGQLFSSGSSTATAELLRQYLCYFEPTSTDLTCDFTTVAQRVCTAHIDTITCPDGTTNFPPDVVIDAPRMKQVMMRPVNSSDCRVYVYDSVYQFLKTSVRTTAAMFNDVPLQPNGRGAFKLVMPRRDLGARMIMLLRPAFVRIQNSSLYSVDYTASGTDGMLFDSDANQNNAVLQLVPVTSSVIEPQDDNGAPPASHFLQLGGGRNDGALLRPPAPPPDSPYKVDTPRMEPVNIVCYYLKYESLNTSLSVNTPRHAVTAFVSVAKKLTDSVSDASGNRLLSITATPSRVATGSALISTAAANGSQYTFTVPVSDTGVVIATRAYDMVIVASMSKARTYVERRHLGSAAGTPFVQANGFTGIPNLADVALNTGTIEPIAKAAGTTTYTRLDASEPLEPGDAVVSPNGQFILRYQSDCNLVLYRVSSGLAVWQSNTSLADMTSGVCSINASEGIVRLYNSASRVYWQTRATASPPDQGPFYAEVTDTGVFQVKGRFGARPVWSSEANSPNSSGVTYLLTCDQAAKRYAADNAAELSRPEFKNMTPWAHYTQIGRLAGYDWPGPPCDA